MNTIFAAQSLLHEGQRAMATERLVNMFPEIAPGRQPVTLRSCPGLNQKARITLGQVEAYQSTNDYLYAVAGQRLWRTEDHVTWADLGALPPGPATMAWNGQQVAIAVGGDFFVWKDTLQEVTGFAFGSVGSVTSEDGYFIVTNTAGDEWAITNLNDGTSIDALDFASAEKRPDGLVRALSSTGMLWLMGANTIEPWQNVGAATFPFQRVASTVLEKGLRSINEAALLDNTIFWNSAEGRAYRQSEFTPQKISTHAVDASLNAHPAARCITYQYEGHDFYAIRFEDRPAWVYGAATQSWHERATGPSFEPWEVTATVQHNGVWYAGTADGYHCTFGGYQDRGEELRREAISKNISQGGERFVVNRLDARVEVGAGGTVMSSYSGNGGRTFSLERKRSLGNTGTYGRRVEWRGLGQHREFCARLACSDPVDFAIYEAGLG